MTLKGYKEEARRLRILMSGASGMIGRPLKTLLTKSGHSVHTLVRKTTSSPSEHWWDPASGEIEAGILSHIDVVVNLSGASIGRIPWTPRHKRAILDSRISATTTLLKALKGSEKTPEQLVQASAVGFYGDRGDDDLTEESSRGSGYLSEVVEKWEGVARELVPEETRLSLARTGLVLGKGGALSPLRLQTALGVGGKIGTGHQWWPWISLNDVVSAYLHLIEGTASEGIYNLVGPSASTSMEITTELAKQMKRPHWVGLPSFAVPLLGEAGPELLLTSRKIAPIRLEEEGFVFQDTTVSKAIARALTSD